MPKHLNPIPPESTRNPDDELIANPRFVVYLLKTIDGKMDEQKLNTKAYQERIEKQFEDINRKLEDIPTKYVTKEEYRESVKALKEEFEESSGRVLEKVNGIDATLQKVNWIVISAVIVALLGLIITKGNLPVG